MELKPHHSRTVFGINVVLATGNVVLPGKRCLCSFVKNTVWLRAVRTFANKPTVIMAKSLNNGYKATIDLDRCL
jgi:hypothetical protein